MTNFQDLLVSPFVENPFMRRALVGALALSLSSPPLGILLSLRRMSLFGDALSHAVLPGVAIAFLFFGLSLPSMSVGGLVAGLSVVALSGWTSRHTLLREDATLAAIYLVALALGVMLISLHGTQLDLLHILFGSILAVDKEGLLLMTSISTLILILLATLYRGLLLESFDPLFLAACAGNGERYQQAFLFMVVLNLVAAFQTLGTLMAIGLMMIPAISARLWSMQLSIQFAVAILFAIFSSISGLLLSFHFSVPSGPSIVICAGVLFAISIFLAPNGWLRSLLRRPHLAA